MRDRDSSRSGALVGESPKLSASVLTHDMEARVDDILLATRCSVKFIGCVTTYVPISTAVRAERGQILAFTVMGALTGASLGLLWSVLYRRNRSMDQQLRRAIRRDELRLVYQPIVDLASGRIVGAEALIRWSDDQGIPVGAEAFIALAEQKGYAGEITRLVIRHVLRDFGEVFNRCPAFRVNLNIAVSDLIDPSFLPALEEMRRQARVPAANLGIEITEGSTAHQDAAIETIRELRHAGHTVHIDDFGTGYSSLSYLAHLAVDAIKIDKAFTHAIGTGSVTVGILPQILAIAETLKMAVIVEGVETREQVNYFKEIAKPVLAQGWFFGRPSPLNEFLRMLAENEKRIEYYMDSPLESKPSRAVPIRET
jgi:sensor c-di-GMP phosphodiesterase-like protein